MRRRDFIVGIAGSAAAGPPLARAQQAGRTYRIGLLSGARDDSAGSNVMVVGYPAFRDELRKRGFIAGRNLVIEFRSTVQEPGKVFADAAELVRSNVDLMVASGPELALKAALAASSTVPIVVWA